MRKAQRLLAENEPGPVIVTRPDGASPFFLTCDHAGRRIPSVLGDLGVSEKERQRHIAWDIGSAAVAHHLSALLDACLVEQVYSRLVIDCNRDPSVPSSIPVLSECTTIPGNVGLSEFERARRVREIFEPYQARTRAELDRRQSAGRETILVAIHSFTPIFEGDQRPWHVGVLYHRDERLAHALMDLFQREGNLIIGDNEPYQVSDEMDYGIPVHGEKRGLVHVELELRQDLIANDEGQRAWAERLARLLPQARARL
ncbi:N-formylglutamate amidohydrolase [Salinicola sp. MH3R3-1]|nr:N-formylglutamate amidohydrolase [Salinicola sp. MH3R3-1]